MKWSGYYAFLVLTSLYFIAISSRATLAFDYWQNSTQFEKGIELHKHLFSMLDYNEINVLHVCA